MMKTSKVSGRIPAGETAVFCIQAALLLKAGIPLSDGLDSLADTGADPSAIRQIAQTTAKTGSFYEAVKTAGVFPAYMIQMIRIGETVGKLEEALDSLGAYYQREDRLRHSIRRAVGYPLVLLFLMAAVIAVLMIAVLPLFAQVIESLGAAEIGSPAGLMEAGVLIGRCALITIAVLLAGTTVLLLASLSGRGRRLLQRLFTRLPLLRGLYRRIVSGRFASVMAMMLSSGYPLSEALGLAADIVTDPLVREKIGQCREKVESGLPFAQALIRLDLFSGLYARMIQTGEKTGRLDEVMARLAASYEDDTEEALSSFVSLIEPTLVILLSVIIGGILLSVMLPLIHILSLIG